MINGKFYIGQTVHFNQRMSKHLWNANNLKAGSMLISKAIAKHGWNNFQKEVVAISFSKEDAVMAENILIDQYNSLRQNNGYNWSYAGVSGMLGKKMSEETKKLMSVKQKGKKRSEEVKKRLSEAQKALNKKLSPEHKKLLDRTGKKPWNTGLDMGPMSEERKEQNRQYMLSNPNDGQFKEGNAPHNLGKPTPREQVEKHRLKMKGRRLSIKSEFKKGQVPHNRIPDSTREYIKSSTKSDKELSEELGIYFKTIRKIRNE